VFCLATGLVTVYVFQEPSLLSSLQDNGLTDVVLHALLVKDVCFHLTDCWGVISHDTPLFYIVLYLLLPSVLWCCWLGGRKGIRPVKNWVVGCWCGYLSGCEGAGLLMAQLMPLPLTVSCFSKMQWGCTFLVPAHLGSPRQRAAKWVCVCVCCFLILY